VHGHGQCSVCHTIVDECCRGEQIIPEQPDPKNDQKENEENEHDDKRKKMADDDARHIS
jgi:hypothetical protein